MALSARVPYVKEGQTHRLFVRPYRRHVVGAELFLCPITILK
jgi:hypothetical protein